jgi:hypothetical protein
VALTESIPNTLTPATATRFEVVVIDDEGQGGVGYQQTESHCRNVAEWLSNKMPDATVRCSFLTSNGHTFQYFATYVRRYEEGV